jgi:transcriptional/translational regulatory protein YebC/TACO1
MAGHSHSANIKRRKDRQDSARSQLFLKVRKKIENIIREEREVNDKSLSIARENKFPKEKVYQIWEKFKSEKDKNYSLRALYQASYGILIYLESNQEITPHLIKKLNLRVLPLSLLPNYFQLLYSLKINLKENNNNNLEEYLITYLPNEILEGMTYDEKERELIFSSKEEMSRIKKFIEENGLELVIEQEKTIWKALIPYRLAEKEELNYHQELEKQLKNSKFYSNVEK